MHPNVWGTVGVWEDPTLVTSAHRGIEPSEASSRASYFLSQSRMHHEIPSASATEPILTNEGAETSQPSQEQPALLETWDTCGFSQVSTTAPQVDAQPSAARSPEDASIPVSPSWVVFCSTPPGSFQATLACSNGMHSTLQYIADSLTSLLEHPYGKLNVCSYLYACLAQVGQGAMWSGIEQSFLAIVSNFRAYLIHRVPNPCTASSVSLDPPQGDTCASVNLAPSQQNTNHSEDSTSIAAWILLCYELLLRCSNSNPSGTEEARLLYEKTIFGPSMLERILHNKAIADVYVHVVQMCVATGSNSNEANHSSESSPMSSCRPPLSFVALLVAFIEGNVEIIARDLESCGTYFLQSIIPYGVVPLLPPFVTSRWIIFAQRADAHKLVLSTLRIDKVSREAVLDEFVNNFSKMVHPVNAIATKSSFGIDLPPDLLQRLENYETFVCNVLSHFMDASRAQALICDLMRSHHSSRNGTQNAPCEALTLNQTHAAEATPPQSYLPTSHIIDLLNDPVTARIMLNVLRSATGLTQILLVDHIRMRLEQLHTSALNKNQDEGKITRHQCVLDEVRVWAESNRTFNEVIMIYDKATSQFYTIDLNLTYDTTSRREWLRLRGNVVHLASLCINYQNGTCRAHERCNMIHAHRETIRSLRPKSCCAVHGHSPSSSLKGSSIRVRVQVPNELEPTLVEERFFAVTAGWLQLRSGSAIPAATTPPLVTNLAHHGNATLNASNSSVTVLATSPSTVDHDGGKEHEEGSSTMTFSATSHSSPFSSASTTTTVLGMPIALDSSGRPLLIEFLSLCRQHQREACGKPSTCKFIHICREKWRDIFVERGNNGSGSGNAHHIPGSISSGAIPGYGNSIHSSCGPIPSTAMYSSRSTGPNLGVSPQNTNPMNFNVSVSVPHGSNGPSHVGSHGSSSTSASQSHAQLSSGGMSCPTFGNATNFSPPTSATSNLFTQKQTLAAAHNLLALQQQQQQQQALVTAAAIQAATAQNMMIMNNQFPSPQQQQQAAVQAALAAANGWYGIGNLLPQPTPSTTATSFLQNLNLVNQLQASQAMAAAAAAAALSNPFSNSSSLSGAPWNTLTPSMGYPSPQNLNPSSPYQMTNPDMQHLSNKFLNNAVALSNLMLNSSQPSQNLGEAKGSLSPSNYNNNNNNQSYSITCLTQGNATNELDTLMNSMATSPSLPQGLSGTNSLSQYAPSQFSAFTPNVDVPANLSSVISAGSIVGHSNSSAFWNTTNSAVSNCPSNSSADSTSLNT